MADLPEPTSRSGGGIVFGGSRDSGEVDATTDLGAFARALRRRWASGVAVVTVVTPDGSLRGVTVSSLMMVSLDPPSLAIAMTREASFHEFLPVGGSLAIAILDRAQEFTSERFAGRAPVPDARFTGVAFDRAANGTPVLRGSLGWARCTVTTRLDEGDHVLIVGAIHEGTIPPDTDEPLINYEAQYRGLEVR